jgi:DNA-binding transcriptional ArsR family regulator
MSGPTTDMLRALLTDTMYGALEVLADSAESLSGRAIAAQVGVAPTTATAALAKLGDAGLVESVVLGRSEMWSVNDDSSVTRSWLEERRSPSGRDFLVAQKTAALLKVWTSSRANAADQRRMLKKLWPALYQALNGLETTESVTRNTP